MNRTQIIGLSGLVVSATIAMGSLGYNMMNATQADLTATLNTQQSAEVSPFAIVAAEPASNPSADSTSNTITQAFPRIASQDLVLPREIAPQAVNPQNASPQLGAPEFDIESNLVQSAPDDQDEEPSGRRRGNQRKADHPNRLERAGNRG